MKLEHLIKYNVQRNGYEVFGYKGKQVRDNTHSEDVARFMLEFAGAPRVAEVYNLGGGRENFCSSLEALEISGEITGIPMKWRDIEQNRASDHICHYCGLRKMKSNYPAWGITKRLRGTFEEIAAGQLERAAGKTA